LLLLASEPGRCPVEPQKTLQRCSVLAHGAPADELFAAVPGEAGQADQITV